MAKSNGDWYPYQRWHRLLNVLAPLYLLGQFAGLSFVPGLRTTIRRPDFDLSEASKTWHGDSRWFLRNKRWVIINARTSSDKPPDDWARLEKPSRRRNFEDDDSDTWRKARPNWRVINEEHTAFSLLHQGYGLKASHE